MVVNITANSVDIPTDTPIKHLPKRPETAIASTQSHTMTSSVGTT